MYTDNIYFKKPDDENKTIWRYMDFTKFSSLISTGQLFFNRGDLFEDKFEGSLTEATFSRINNSAFDKFYRAHFPSELVKAYENNKKSFWREVKKWTVINCWHMNEYESDAMWKLYASKNAGVAVKSTFRQLADSFAKDTQYKEYIGEVSYIDRQLEEFPHDSKFYPFTFKDKSFSFEQELRVAISKFPGNEWLIKIPAKKQKEECKNCPHGEKIVQPESGPFNGGLSVLVDLEVLITEIRVSPLAGDWFRKLVQKAVDDSKLNKNVLMSPLAKAPPESED